MFLYEIVLFPKATLTHVITFNGPESVRLKGTFFTVSWPLDLHGLSKCWSLHYFLPIFPFCILRSLGLYPSPSYMLLPSHKHLHQDCATWETSTIRVRMKDLSDFQTCLHEVGTTHTHHRIFNLDQHMNMWGLRGKSERSYLSRLRTAFTVIPLLIEV